MLRPAAAPPRTANTVVSTASKSAVEARARDIRPSSACIEVFAACPMILASLQAFAAMATPIAASRKMPPGRKSRPMVTAAVSSDERLDLGPERVGDRRADVVEVPEIERARAGAPLEDALARGDDVGLDREE